MDRITGTERPDWHETARRAGFDFAQMHGEPYWDERAAYRFTLAEIEGEVEDVATELHAMACEAAARIASDDDLMERLAIPEAMRGYVRASLPEPALYGRMDLAYGAGGPAKLLEYNADTPTSLYESASFQWTWLEEARAAGLIPEGADQLNSIYEALVERLGAIFPDGAEMHFAAALSNPEDYATVETLAYAAREAGLGAHPVEISAIGLSADGQLADGEDRIIGTLFKLYPWEDMLRDEFAAALPGSATRILEPAWKALVSNKGILPVLWEMHPDHPNLLPAFFEDDWAAGTPAVLAAREAGHFAHGTASKPLFSREGAGVVLTGPDGAVIEASGDRSYDANPRIVQAIAPLPEMGGMRPVLGAWIVGDECRGLGIREDRSAITQDLSRFVPHFISD